jgi:hypothetical protein
VRPGYLGRTVLGGSMKENAPSNAVSPQGRRVLVAVVNGEAGERIQAWRLQHDPREAARIPPHTTLCYWATGLDVDDLGLQVCHAFPAAIPIGLGEVAEFEDEQGTFYVKMLQTSALDAARRRLYDATHLDMGPAREWPWHVTCVRNTNGRDRRTLRSAAATLAPGDTWLLDEVACLELRGDRYETVRSWRLDR